MTSPQLTVACILERHYGFDLEATLEAAGFDEDNVSFVKPVDPAEGVVASALSPADRAWAAQHVDAWRRCEATDVPMLIFQSDVAFASSGVLEATKALLASADACEVLYLGAAAPFIAELAPAAGHALLPAQSATQTAAYVLWPAAARHLLESLPMDAPVLSFLDKRVAGQKLAASPAIAISI